MTEIAVYIDTVASVMNLACQTFQMFSCKTRWEITASTEATFRAELNVPEMFVKYITLLYILLVHLELLAQFQYRRNDRVLRTRVMCCDHLLTRNV